MATNHYFEREIEKLVKKSARSFSALVITGARQVGKSTMLKQLFPKHSYVSLDEMDTRLRAIEDPRGFLMNYKLPLIIDEIQEAPSILSYIKKIIDDKRGRTGLFIITGSQQFSLMEGVQESLAGRCAVLDLSSFSIFELESNLQKKEKITTQKKTEKPWAAYVERGSYPELCLKPKLDRKLWYSSYLRTFIDRDIKSNLNKSYLKHFEQFIFLLLARCSQELNYTDIAKDLGVDLKTIKAWIALLERSQIIFLLNPYPKKIENKQISKKPKLYFYDSGLIAHSLGYHTQEQIQAGPLAGALFENLIISELQKRKLAKISSEKFYFFREKNGLEVDLIIEKAEKLNLIEIKSSQTPTLSSAKNLLKFKALVPNIKEAYLVSAYSEEFSSQGIKFRFFKNFLKKQVI